MFQKLRWILIGIALLLALGLSVPGQLARWKAAQRAEAAASLLASAKAVEENDLEAAFLRYQALSENQPESAEAWQGLARVYVAAGMPLSAEPAATHVVELAPSAESLLARAQIRETLQRHGSAKLDVKRALELAPGNAKAKAMLEQLEAVTAPASPRLAPPRERYWPGRLAEYVRQLPQDLRARRLDAAGKLVAAAARDYPDTMFGPWLAGILKYSQGDFTTAEIELKRALAFAPRSSRVATNLAGTWAKQGGPAAAAEKLIALQEADPSFVIPLDIAATAYLEARTPALAEQALKRGTTRKDAPAQAYLQLANHYEVLDRASDAQRACDDGLGRLPQSVELALCRARWQAAQGFADVAIASYEVILRDHPDSRAARAALLRLYASKPESPAQQRAYELMMELRLDSPDEPDLLDAVGWALARRNDGSALNWLALAAQGAPETPSIRYHYGVALANAKARDAAHREFSAALAAGNFPEKLDAQRRLRE